LAIQFPQNLSRHLIIYFIPLSSGLLHCLVNWNTIRDLLKMGTIKDRNGMDLIEAEDIKKRWLWRMIEKEELPGGKIQGPGRIVGREFLPECGICIKSRESPLHKSQKTSKCLKNVIVAVDQRLLCVSHA